MKATIGRIVHYVMPNGEHRPAIVVRDWGSCQNLQVFLDGTNDVTSPCLKDKDGKPGFAAVAFAAPATAWMTSVQQEEPAEGKELAHHTWHWPEREPE